MTVYRIDADGNVVQTIKNAYGYTRDTASVRHDNGFISSYSCSEGSGEFFSPVPDPKPTVEERLAAAEDKNRVLEAKVKAQNESITMLEDCLVEMAGVVYA